MTTERNPSVVISGAGPAGAVLAYLLVRAGVKTTLVERHEDFSREFRGELLMPSGLEPLHQIGLWQDFEKVGQVRIDRFRMFINRKPFISPVMNPAKTALQSPRWVSQPHLLEMLVKKASAFSGFTLLRGTRVRSLLQKEDHVVGVATDTHGDVRADLVIGCDGRSSIVRARSGIKAKADALPMDIVWLKLPCLPNSISNSIHFYVGQGRLVLVAPTYDGGVQVGFIIAKGSFKTLRELGTKGLIKRIASYVDADVAHALLSSKSEDVKPFLLSTVADCVDSWSRPGLLLLGDAAHTMSPVGGQGLNIAIRDAVVAANHLIPALREHTNSNELLSVCRAIEEERLQEVKTIQTNQANAPKLMLSQSIGMRLLFGIVQKIVRGREINASSDPAFKQMLMGVTPVLWRGDA